MTLPILDVDADRSKTPQTLQDVKFVVGRGGIAYMAATFTRGGITSRGIGMLSEGGGSLAQAFTMEQLMVAKATAQQAALKSHARACGQ